MPALIAVKRIGEMLWRIDRQLDTAGKMPALYIYMNLCPDQPLIRIG